jgi:cell division protein FtsB
LHIIQADRRSTTCVNLFPRLHFGDGLLFKIPTNSFVGGSSRVNSVSALVSGQHGVNLKLASRNGGLEGEVRDLKQGLLAVEEQARYKLGMVRPDEIFIQFNRPTEKKDSGKSTAALANLSVTK